MVMGSARKEGGSAHLRFEMQPLEAGCILHRYKVLNTQFDEYIGIIHWRGGWRQYVFQALPKIDMSISCHREIDAFIDKLMAERVKR